MFNHVLFKILLDKKGIKQAQLARITGIPRNSICRYLSGDVQPKADKVKLLAEALGVSMESLLIKDAAELANASTPTPKQKRQPCFCPFCGEKLSGLLLEFYAINQEGDGQHESPINS